MDKWIASTGFEFDRAFLWLSEITRQVEKRIELAEDALQMGLEGKTHLRVLQATNMTAAMKDVNDFAKEANLIPIVSAKNDYIHLPSSISATEDGFAVIIHVPLAEAGSILDVFQHVPIPIPAGNNTYIEISTHSEILAIDADRTRFRVTDSNDLSTDCYKIGNFFACPRGNVARDIRSMGKIADDDEACLVGLFTGKQDIMSRTCKKTFVKPGPRAVQISARKFTTYGETRGTIACRGTPFKTNFHTQLFGSINLPAGCSVASENFHLSSSDGAYTREESDWYHSRPLPEDINSLLEGIDTKRLTELMEDSSHGLNKLHKISFAEVKRHIAESRPSAYIISGFSVYAIILCLSLSGLTYSVILHRKINLYMSPKTLQTPNPSAPPATIVQVHQ